MEYAISFLCIVVIGLVSVLWRAHFLIKDYQRNDATRRYMIKRNIDLHKARVANARSETDIDNLLEDAENK